MIVKCEQCQTKFKIPDEKVTDKGVKVRCTKCQNTFRVKRTDGQADAAPLRDLTAPQAPPPPAPLPPRSVARLAPPPKASALAPARPAQSFQTASAPLAAPDPAVVPAFDPSNPFENAAAPTPRAPPPLPKPPPLPPQADPAPGPKPLMELDFEMAAPPSGFDAAERDPFAMDEPPAPAPREDLFGAPAEEPRAAPPEPAQPKELFDIPDAEPEPKLAPAALAPIASPVARIALVSAPVLKPANPQAVAGLEPKGSPGVARRATGVVVNLAVAAALVVALAAVGNAYLNEGKLDPQALLKTLKPAAGWVAQDVSNGLYDTRAGRPVFFVRGEVQNKGAAAAVARVRAEILEGTQVLQSAEALAGQTPTPEDLYGLSSVQDALRLSERLGQKAARVAPGQTAPFVVTFYDYPPDLAGLRLKVTVTPVAPPPTATR